MKKQAYQFIAVVVVLIVFIGAYIGVKQYNAKQEDKKTAQEEADTKYVAQIASGDVTSFSYEVNGSALHFTKSDKTWSCQEDPTLNLDASKVEAMLSALDPLRAAEAVSDPDALSEYGFDSPTNTITVTTKAGTTKLTIGMKNPVTSQYYITSDKSSDLYLVDETVVTTFSKAATDLIVADTETETVPKVSTEAAATATEAAK